jgi:UPF0271 protein
MGDRAVIDLNADVGEGCDGDDDLLAVVSSANVACGFHAGDPATMRATCRVAVERGVAIGAHVGYRDREGFGRRELGVEPGVLHDETLSQLGALAAVATAAGGAVRHVKPHGALYHRCATDAAAADAVVAAVRSFDRALLVVGPPASALLRAAGEAGVAEAFADRAYRADGGLVPRTEPGAVLAADAAAAQGVRLATERRVAAADGTEVEVDARTLCVHGDTPAAVALASGVREALERAGVTIAPFA